MTQSLADAKLPSLKDKLLAPNTTTKVEKVVKKITNKFKGKK